MKKIYALFFFCWLATTLSSQPDTTRILRYEETGTLTPQRYIEAREYIFMTQVPTRGLLKIPLLQHAPIDQFQYRTFERPEGLSLVGYERKLTPSLSVNTSVNLSVTTDIVVNNLADSEFRVSRLGLSVEPRYYLGMARGVREGTRADNLSGNYVGLRLGHGIYRGFEVTQPQPFLLSQEGWNTSWSTLLTAGIQRRLLRRGFLNISVGVGAAQRQDVDVIYEAATDRNLFQVTEGWQPAFLVEAQLGLAFGEGRPEEGLLCDALRCFREEKQLLKIDLINLAQVMDLDQQGGYLNVAYEKKIGRSSFSWQADAELQFNLYDLNDYTGQYLSGSLGLEGRYYYNLRRRIARGKSANNLSADYLALRFSGSSFYLDTEAVANDQEESDRWTRWLVMPMWGIQRRVFRHGFIGYQFGLGLGREYGRAGDANSLAFDSRSRLQIGLAF